MHYIEKHFTQTPLLLVCHVPPNTRIQTPQKNNYFKQFKQEHLTTFVVESNRILNVSTVF